jgi:hypothetical protein
MVLTWSIGKEIAGNVCAADVAFNDFERQISRFEIGRAWDWFVDRVVALEQRLDALGGLDERIADQLDETGTFMGPAEVVERYDQAYELCWLLDEAATAFIVTLQPRLNALHVTARAIYEKAAVEDSLSVTVPTKLETLFPAFLVNVWNVANYVKHRDEWRAELNKQQRPSFETLLSLGVAAGAHNHRALARFPTIEAVIALAGKTWLREAIPGVLALCAVAHGEMVKRIQYDFQPFATAIEARRSENRRRTREVSVPR